MAGVVLTVVGEYVPADALVHQLALGQGLLARPLRPAGAVLRDQPRDGALVQDVRRGALSRKPHRKWP